MPPVWVWLLAGIGILAILVAAAAWQMRRHEDEMMSPDLFPKPPTPPTLPLNPNGTISPVPLAPLPPTPDDLKSDRRSGYRRVGNPVLVELTPDDDVAISDMIEGWVIDRSRQGLRLTTNVPKSAGHRFKVRVKGAPESTPWLPVEVRHCERAPDGSYELGCQFLQEPSWEELLLFG